MKSVCQPTFKPIVNFCMTATHRAAVASWVTKHSGVLVEYDEAAEGWAYSGDSRIVLTTMHELSHRMLQQRVDISEPTALTMAALRSRLSYWRTHKPNLSVYTWPNTRGLKSLPAKLTVWVMALPWDAYPFAEAAFEFQGLRDRFTVVTWIPCGECGDLHGLSGAAFGREHGLASMSRPRGEDAFLMFGTSENVMSALEALTHRGRVVRKGRKAPLALLQKAKTDSEEGAPLPKRT